MSGPGKPPGKLPGKLQGETGQEDREKADKASQDNDLTTGHGDPDDGGDDNAEPQKQK